MADKKLTRSDNKVIAGVCGGLAAYFDLDPTLVRVIYTVATIVLACFPGVLIYIIMMLIIPQGPNNTFGGREVEDVEIKNK